MDEFHCANCKKIFDRNDLEECYFELLNGTTVGGKYLVCKKCRDIITVLVRKENFKEVCGAYSEYGLGPDGKGCQQQAGHQYNHGDILDRKENFKKILDKLPENKNPTPPTEDF